MNNLLRPSFPIGKGTPEDVEANWQPASFAIFPINYLNIPELNEDEKQILSQYYFVAVNGNAEKSFTQLYRENRLDGVSNFVTADSIIHPLFAFRNAIRLRVIERSIIPSLKSLLSAMLESGQADYLTAEDAEVKEEIKHNLAYIFVGLKLLVPDTPLPQNPGVKQLVVDELTKIKQAGAAKSGIFHRLENYSLYQPIGWYKTTEGSQRFFRCCQWLGRAYLELSDSTADADSGNGNQFRRAFLLFGSLMRAKANKEDWGLSTWKQINQSLIELGISAIDRDNPKDADQYVLPDNLALIFPTAKSVSRISLASLSDPLSRTRLFLAVRGNAPRQQLNTTSIFSLSKKDADKDKDLKFHFIAPLYEPDKELSFQGAIFQQDPSVGFNLTPVALVLASHNGVAWGKKVLSDNSFKLNEQFNPTPPAGENNLAGTNSAPINYGPFWRVFQGFSGPYSQNNPVAFQTAQWRTFCLERQVSAWVDRLLAGPGKITLPAENTGDKTQPNTATGLSTNIKRIGISVWRTNNSFNFLEPTADLYENLTTLQTTMESWLNQSGLFPPEYLEQNHDFVRLTKRLASISRRELDNQALTPEDQALLASIDKVLQAIETPLSGNQFISFRDYISADDDLGETLFSRSQPGKNVNKSSIKSIQAVIKLGDSVSESKPAPNRTEALSVGTLKPNNQGLRLTGVNMSLGYPVTVYLILQYKRMYYLLRGGVYSYYEQCGEEINEKHWQRQIEFGFPKLPFWCESFQKINQTVK